MGLFLPRITFFFLLIHWYLPLVCNKPMGQCVYVMSESEINRRVACNVYRDNILTYRAKQCKSVEHFDYISRISMWYRLIAKRILPCPWRNLTKPLGSHLQFRGSHRSFVWQHFAYGLQYTSDIYVIDVYIEGNPSCCCLMVTKRPSNISLPLINSLNKTKSGFSRACFASWGLSLSSV